MSKKYPRWQVLDLGNTVAHFWTEPNKYDSEQFDGLCRNLLLETPEREMRVAITCGCCNQPLPLYPQDPHHGDVVSFEVEPCPRCCFNKEGDE